MSLFGRDSSVTTTFNAKDNMSPVVRGIRRTMDDFKRDAKTGFGLAGGISVFNLATDAIGAVVNVLGDAQTAYRSDQVSQTQLRAALEANIDAWNGNTDAIEDVIAARMKLGFSDDEQRANLALLVAQVKNVNDALAIQRTAMDLARLKGMSLADASNLLAKAYNGSATGLQRMGIQISRGTKGMAALGEVQQRVAGQAEEWANTSTGAAAAFDVKVGELQEKIGSFVDGAGRGFIQFLSGVVDVIDGPDGASANIRDLTGTIVMLRSQTDALTKGDPFQRMAEDMAGWNEQLRAAEEIYRNDTWFKWVAALGPDTLRNFGKAGAETMADVRALAQGVIDAGGSFGEFALIVRQKVAPSFNVLTGAWTGAASGIDSAADDMRGSFRSIPRATMHAVTDMKATIADGKAGIIEQFRDLAWQTKHPFAQVRYEEWLRRKQAAAVRKMKEAAKAGKPGVVEQYRQLVADIQAELSGLPGYTAGIVADVIADLASVGSAVTSAMGYGADGEATPVPKRRRRRRNRNKKRNAIGGYIGPGERSLVGENGPEIIEVAGGGGLNVTPNHRMGQPINVYVDGQRLFRILDARTGRAVAMGG